MEKIIKKRGRPPGSRNKITKPTSKRKTKIVDGVEIFPKYRYDPNKEYVYWFIAEACGCRIGSNICGAGMWCKHKNTMHLEERK